VHIARLKNEISHLRRAEIVISSFRLSLQQLQRLIIQRLRGAGELLPESDRSRTSKRAAYDMQGDKRANSDALGPIQFRFLKDLCERLSAMQLIGGDVRTSFD
jgi:hypothetical protein